MEATELARWTRFAAKGGIGKCTALVDCVAENPDDLMFFKVSSGALWRNVRELNEVERVG